MGATDSKCCNLELSQQLVFDFVVGPICDGASKMPPFNFSEEGEFIAHRDHPLGYWDVYPNIWMQTTNFACAFDDFACDNGKCTFGYCECNGFYQGSYCQTCPAGFDDSCAACLQGYELKDGQCLFVSNDVLLGLAIGVPIALICIMLAILAFIYYKKGGFSQR